MKNPRATVFVMHPGALGGALVGALRRRGAEVTLELPPPGWTLCWRILRRLAGPCVAARMAARAAFERAFGARVARRLRRGRAPDLVVTDAAVARELARHGRPVDVLVLDRGPFDAIHAALDVEAEAAPAFRGLLRAFRASPSACSLERVAIGGAAQVIAASRWIARAAVTAGARSPAVVAPALPPAPASAARAPGPLGQRPLRVLCPGPLAGRNGARALLEAAVTLGRSVELRFAGRVVEDEAVVAPWRGCFQAGAAGGGAGSSFEALCDSADVVAAPWVVDGYSPDVAVALARRLPVVATEAAGIDALMPGVMRLSAGAPGEVVRALEALRDDEARHHQWARVRAVADLRQPARVEEALCRVLAA